MAKRITGEYHDIVIYGDECRSFVPFPLPPDPSIQVDSGLRSVLDAAQLALGRLDGSIAIKRADPGLLLYGFVRREAVLSSQIEGTQSSLSDFLLFESGGAPGVPVVDVTEVSNYVAAMEYGIRQIRNGASLSSTLLQEIHGVLLRKGRGSEKTPGKFRIEPNWIGGNRPSRATFVPPSNREIPRLMAELERFLTQDLHRTPTLVRAALAHVQFETIHPFLDGNGRLGRLLVTLLLCAEDVLREPLLYLSLYIKQHQSDYYDLLQGVRSDGDWESWLYFFARGVTETAESATVLADEIYGLFNRDRILLRQNSGRRSASAMRAHRAFEQWPILGVSELAQRTGLTPPTASSIVGLLESLGVVEELTGNRKNRRFAYREYLALLNEGTEL